MPDANMNQAGSQNGLSLSTSDVHDLTEKIKRQSETISILENQISVLRASCSNWEQQYHSVADSKIWKMTKPLRWILDFLKKIPVIRLGFKFLKSIRQCGIRGTFFRVKQALKCKKHRPAAETPADLEKQRKTHFETEPTVSVLVPLYNTPEKFLREMIGSVTAQTYGKWELCLADGSDAQHGNVEKTVKELQKKDSRILYRKLEKNLGISENTNACLDMASGDYIGLFDHDDLLHPSALYYVVKAINEKHADFIYTDENTFTKTPKDAFQPHFKPDFSPDTLRSYNYICHFSVFSKQLLDKVGKFRKECDGSQDYDLLLRLTEQAESIVHIPKILYYWRAHANSTASSISAKPYIMDAAKLALREHLERVGLCGTVEDSRIPSTYRIRYEIQGNPLISILIPNKDHTDDLEKCLASIRNISTYSNYEIIVIENNSTDLRTFDYYKQITDPRVKVVTWKPETPEFNYSAINNFGATQANGEYLILLNNDIEITTPDWMEEMLMFCQRKDVGAAGMLLCYPDDTVQHAGVIIGIGGVAGHSHKYLPKTIPGYASRLSLVQNLSAVTAACLMVRKDVFDELHGLDESFKVAFNDVDFCMRIRKAGYLIVFTPYAEAYHYESKSRGLDTVSLEKQKRFEGEVLRFQTRWGAELDAGDPYYNPNLSLEREDFSVR